MTRARASHEGKRRCKRESLQEAIGLVTYSNSGSTVFSNTSLFESFWIQSELDKQNKTKHVCFLMFKGFKLKDKVSLQPALVV